jgi:hypothetical protein
VSVKAPRAGSGFAVFDKRQLLSLSCLDPGDEYEQWRFVWREGSPVGVMVQSINSWLDASYRFDLVLVLTHKATLDGRRLIFKVA